MVVSAKQKAADRATLIGTLRKLEEAKQKVLRELADKHLPPLEWRGEVHQQGLQLVESAESIILYVGRRPAGHVWLGRAQLTKTPKITWEDSWFWRLVGQDWSHRCSTRSVGMIEVEARVHANRLAFVDPRDFLEAPGG